MNKFSIIVPTLNSYSLLNSLIHSIKCQTWQKWEVVFVDGGSRKEHITFLDKVCKKDLRFSFIRQEKHNKGIFGAMNQGTEIIDKNSWILFLGSDDMLIDNTTLEKLNNKINSSDLNKMDLIICRGKYFDIRRKVYSREAYFINKKFNYFFTIKDYKKLIFCGFTPPHQSTFFNGKSRIFEKIYNDKFRIAGDLEFFCRIAMGSNLRIANIPIDIVHISTGGVSDRKYIFKLIEVIKCYLKYFKFNFLFPFVLRYLNRLKQIL